MFRYHTKQTAPAESQALIDASVNGGGAQSRRTPISWWWLPTTTTTKGEAPPPLWKPLVWDSATTPIGRGFRLVKTYGFFPNLHQVLAEAPAAYKACLETFGIFEKETTLTTKRHESPPPSFSTRRKLTRARRTRLSP